MDEPEGNGGGDFTGGTGGGGHGGIGHVPRGQPAGIGAGQLYFLVVTACLVLAIMAIWLLCYGVKWCRKICKKRSQRRVGCFPTEETSGVALNQDWTHGDVCINMDMDTGKVETKPSSNGRKADHTVINMFDDEDEVEALPQLYGSINGISRNSDVRIQMNEEQKQEKEYEEISTGIDQREDQEINQNETHENETCQVEARSLDVAETKENLQERIQLAPAALSCTILMPAIQEAEEYDSSSEEELKDLGNSRLPSPKYGSSNEGDTELPSSVTCELGGQRESDQDTDDDSFGSESSDEELQPSNLPGTVDYYRTIQLEQTMPRSMIMDVTEHEMDNGSGSESELEGQGNQAITDYDSSNEVSSVMAVPMEEELDSGTESQDELQTSGQLESTSDITQANVEAEAVDVAGTIENMDERIQLAQEISCTILMPPIHEAEEYESSSEEEFMDLGNNQLSSPSYGSSNEGEAELASSATFDLEDQRESDQDTEDESCGSKSNSSLSVASELESQRESDQDTEDESYGTDNSVEEQLLNLPEIVDYYEIIQLGPTTPSTTIMDVTEQETDNGSGSESELGEQENQQITDYESSNEGSSIMAVAMEEESDSGAESQDESETSGQQGSTPGITQQSSVQAQAMSVGTLMNSEKKNYASSAEDELEEEENDKITDYESSDEASVTSSSSMTTEFGEDWEGDNEGHQLEVHASNVPETADDMQENSEPTGTDAEAMVMHDDDCEIGIESRFEEMESSPVIGDLLGKDMEPQKDVVATSTGKGDQEQIPSGILFSVSNDNAGPFDDNQIEDVALVYTLNIDEEPPESPSAQLARESDPPLQISGGTPEIPPSSIEDTCDSPRPKRQITPVHQVRSEWELADAVAADASDMSSSAWQRALEMDPDLLEYAQAEGDWMGKVDCYTAETTHEMTIGNTDDVLGIGPGILTAILEPVNRYLPQVISPSESQMQLVQAGGPAQVSTEDFDDGDQEATHAAGTRLTRPKFPEIFTLSPSNAGLTPGLREEEDNSPSIDEELEQEIEAYASMAPQLEAQLATWKLPEIISAEGNPCSVHEKESGGGLGISGQLSAWWDSAVRALTPNSVDENANSYADTVAGIVTDKCNQEESEIAEQKDDDGCASEGVDSDEENSKAFEEGQGLKDATDQSKDQVYEDLADKSSE